MVAKLRAAAAIVLGKTKRQHLASSWRSGFSCCTNRGGDSGAMAGK
jgi:hypothetical protein